MNRVEEDNKAAAPESGEDDEVNDDPDESDVGDSDSTWPTRNPCHGESTLGHPRT